MECVDFNDVSNKHFVVSAIKDLLENVQAQNIIDFVSNRNVFILMFAIYFLF